MTEVSTLRLFVAVAVPDSELVKVEEATAELKRELRGARWVPRANQHVTLKFLGTTPSDRVDAVAQVCRIVARSHAPAEVTLTRLGAFPSARRARVLWVGLDDPAALLQRLAEDLADAFEPLGYGRESRSFTPHLTLARFKELRPLPPLPALADGFQSFSVSAIELLQSRLHPQGARYELLETFALVG